MAARKSPPKSVVQVSLTIPLFCFFLSGAAGLIYQVAWTKSLTLLFGHTTYAVSTVLAIFLGGLALGSALIPKYLFPVASPPTDSAPSLAAPSPLSALAGRFNEIALYAYLELAIAATGLFSFFGLAAVRALYLSQFHPSAGSPFLRLTIRILGAALVLLPPTFLMGGTFPILIRGVTRHTSELNRRLSRFYAINTLGAVVGTLTAGFFLLPAVGLRMTIVFAVILNLLAGILALKHSRRAAAQNPTLEVSSTAKPATKKSTLAVPRIAQTLLLLLFIAVGATAIAYEISWTRLLSTMLGSSTYSFTLMLATFLAGIVAGSFAFEKWSAKRSATLATFSHTQVATAVAALFFLLIFHELPSLIPAILHFTSDSFSGLLLAQLTISALAMFPAAAIFGFNFPLVISLIARTREVEAPSAHDVGRAYAANTLGAIIAAISVGFFMLPRIGAFRVVALTAILNLLLAIFLTTRIESRRPFLLAAQAAALALIAFVGFSSHFYDKALANFSAVLYGSIQPGRLTVEEIANTEDVVYFADGLNATISVTRSEDYVALKTNGKVDASTIDTSTQLLLGHLGAIFHPHPRRVLIIGFGGGMTASAVSKYPDVESIDCVEIEPAVIHAAPYLRRLNRGVLQDPRLHIIYDDARNFVQTSTKPYDLIISEPSNPWIAGIASLYTSEFYAAIRAHLAPGGMFVQWVQAYALQPSDFRMILATLAPNFPSLSLWRSADRDFLLLARADSSPLNFDRSRQLWINADLQSDFRELHLTQPESWPLYFRLPDSQVRRLAADSSINSDDQTLLEFTAPRSLLFDPQAQTLTELVNQSPKTLLPPDLLPVERARALLATAGAMAETDNPSLAAYLTELDELQAGSPTFALWGRVAQMHDKPAEAITHLSSASPGSHNLFNQNYWLAASYAQLGNVSAQRAALSAAIRDDSNDKRPHEMLVESFRSAGDWQSALAAQKGLLASLPDVSAAEYCLLGDLYLRSGDRISAVPALEAGLGKDPYSYLCHRDLGELQRAAGRNDEARHNLEFVVRYFPEGDAKAYASLALAYIALSRRSGAERILQKGKRIFPEDAFLQRFKLPN